MRRGAPRPPRRKKKKGTSPVRLNRTPSQSQGFEVFLSRTWAEQRLFPELLHSSGALDTGSGGVEHLPLGKRREGGFLASVAFHLFIVLFLVMEPVIFAPSEEAIELAEKPKRLTLFMEEPEPVMPVVPGVPVVPGGPVPDSLFPSQQPQGERLLIPRAALPPPPDKQQEFQNDLPFSEGNTDEFYTDEEIKDPGEEGEPGEDEVVEEEVAKEDDRVEEETTEKEGLDREGAPEGEDVGASETKLADLLPKDPGFTYFGDRPDSTPPPQRASPPPPSAPPASADNGEGGQRGEGGPFRDIRRFLMDKRFHNPEGGLVTGLGRTLYYNDKGADFVPWIRRMLAEVRRNFLMPYSGSFQAGHVAVGVVVSRTGDITGMELIIPSGIAGFDNAATGSLRASDLMPLPSDYPDQTFEFILVFWINEQPYELF